jgi:hypothetical protein
MIFVSLSCAITLTSTHIEFNTHTLKSNNNTIFKITHQPKEKLLFNYKIMFSLIRPNPN